MLVVDDEPAIRYRISDLLIDERDVGATAADVQAALALAAQDSPDLVISDLMMPRRHGLPVLRSLRRPGVMIPMALMRAEPLTQGVVEAPRRSSWTSSLPR